MDIDNRIFAVQRKVNSVEYQDEKFYWMYPKSKPRFRVKVKRLAPRVSVV